MAHLEQRGICYIIGQVIHLLHCMETKCKDGLIGCQPAFLDKAMIQLRGAWQKRMTQGLTLTGRGGLCAGCSLNPFFPEYLGYPFWIPQQGWYSKMANAPIEENFSCEQMKYNYMYDFKFSKKYDLWLINIPYPFLQSTTCPLPFRISKLRKLNREDKDHSLKWKNSNISLNGQLLI